MKGKLKVKSIIEIIGAPQKFVEEAMLVVLAKLKQRTGISILKEQKFEANKMEGKPFWSTFAEIELEFASADDLLNYCFDFLPSSVEIIDPVDFHFQNFEVNNIFNDIIAKLHEYHMHLKNLEAENIILKRETANKEEPKRE